MNFAAFVLFSTIECVAYVYFTLKLFRFSVREYIWKFVLFAIVLSFVSNTLQVESLSALSPIITAALLISFFSFLLKIHIFNAAIMVVTGYVINFIVTFMIISGTAHFSGISEVIPYTTTAYIIQGASSFVMAMLGMVTSLQNGGFSFIHNRSRVQKTKIFSKENKSFIIFLAISIIMIFLANLWYTLSSEVPYLFIAIMLLISLIGLLYLSIKREGQQND